MIWSLRQHLILMINCHRFIGLESHNTHLYVLAGQVPCPAEMLAAFHNRRVVTNVHARCSEQRKDVSTHLPEAALGRKGGKCHVTSFCVFLFSSSPCRLTAHAPSWVFRRGWFSFHPFCCRRFSNYLLLACIDHTAFEPLQEGAFGYKAEKHQLS